MKTYVTQVITELESLNKRLWAEIFVLRRMEFHQLFSGGRIFSTVHGSSFFNNVLDCLNGKKWEPDKEERKPGEYEDNFRAMIAEELKKST